MCNDNYACGKILFSSFLQDRKLFPKCGSAVVISCIYTAKRMCALVAAKIQFNAVSIHKCSQLISAIAELDLLVNLATYSSHFHYVF
jgi:hypothetical protein